jgi:hypothetical protein
MHWVAKKTGYEARTKGGVYIVEPNAYGMRPLWRAHLLTFADKQNRTIAMADKSADCIRACERHATV